MHRSRIRLLCSRSPQQPMRSGQYLLIALWLFLMLPALALAPSVMAQEAFIMRWMTSTASRTITIPTNGEGVSTYDFTIDWGDGVSEHYTGDDPDPEHIYSEAGHYTIAITGTFPRLHLAEASDGSLLKGVAQWRTIAWESMKGAFAGATALVANTLDSPDLSQVRSMQGMFAGATSFNADVSGWDVSNVTDMSELFKDARSFNQSLASWDVSNVTDMRGMFDGASVFNQPLEAWDVSKVTDMGAMFRAAQWFNQSLAGWNVSAVTTMSDMFRFGYRFNQPLGSWDVSNVTDMKAMFYHAESFNQSLGSWDVSNVTNMGSMFLGAYRFNQPLLDWDVSRVTDMTSMFRSARGFNASLNGWKTSNVIDMSAMFYNAFSFNQPLLDWDVSRVMFMKHMFYNALSFNQPLSAWDVSSVSNFGSFLHGAELSPPNYDSLLVAWSQLDLRKDLIIDMGSSTYSEVGQAGRTHIISKYGWRFIDGGLDGASDVEEDPDKIKDESPPATFALHAPFPNPANAYVTIGYDVPEDTEAHLVLYNSLGQAVLILNEGLAGPGVHERSLRLDGLAGGVYVLRLSAGTYAESRTLTLVR